MTDPDLAVASAPARVADGAALLDDTSPGWERSIDLGTLDLRDGSSPSDSEGGCIVCQVTGLSYADGLYAMGVQNGWLYGFLGVSGPEWRALDEAWRSLIKERFAAGALSDGDRF